MRGASRSPAWARWSGPEVLAENRFLAARDGMRAQIIDARTLIALT